MMYDALVVACPNRGWRCESGRPAGVRQAGEEIVDGHAMQNAGLRPVEQLGRAVVEIAAVMPRV